MELKKLELHPPRPKKVVKKFFLLLFVVAAIVACGIFWFIATSAPSVFHYVFSINQLKSNDNRVNVLLLGNAGGSHAGAHLTDSIIFASYNLKTHKVVLVSIPRDLWVDSTKSKINAVYEIGAKRFPEDKGGLKFAEDKIDDIIGIPLHYGVRLNFSGFAKAIDLVEGIEVEVPKTFDDYNYPIEGKEDDLCGMTEKEIDLTEEELKELTIGGNPINLKAGKNKVIVNLEDKIATSSADFACRFEHIRFEQGLLHMEGTQALKFVRSRMGTNGEGSDFARSRRQQLVLQAFRQKVLSLETLFNIQKITGLVDTFGDTVETDIPVERLLDFYRLVKKVDNVSSLVLGDLGQGKSVLINPPPSDYGGAYVLIPPDGDFSGVKEFLHAELEKI